MTPEMNNHPTPSSNEDSPRFLSLLRRARLVLFIAVVTVAFGFGLLLFQLDGATSLIDNRLFFVGIVGLMMSLAWLDTHLDTHDKATLWQDLANRAGLTCHTRGPLLGAAVYVSGNYRGRALTLYAPRQGKAQVQSTRIEIEVAHLDNATLRLRGPFHRNEAVYDTITSQLFATSNAHQYGDHRRFFVRSQPLHLATLLVSNRAVWEQLERLDTLVNIELQGGKLSFERLGMVRHPSYLHNLFDLLSEIADTLERGGQIVARAA